MSHDLRFSLLLVGAVFFPSMASLAAGLLAARPVALALALDAVAFYIAARNTP